MAVNVSASVSCGPVGEDGSRSCSISTGTVQSVTDSRDVVDQLMRRLNTYKGWRSKKTAVELAKAGFTYTGIADKVVCESCGIRLYNWQEEEDPIQAHKKYGPDCEFMLKRFPTIKVKNTATASMKVKYPHYSDYETRLKSFVSWPLKSVAQKPEMMARCGFFYIGSDDRARCFHCGVTLRDWDIDDYPPCVHKQWSAQCPYVQQINVEGMKAEIEEWERLENVKLEDSEFIDCHSPHNQEDDVVEDGVSGTSPCGGDTGLYPAIQAVMEMGYSQEVIEKALDTRRREGCTHPDAVSLLNAIFDMEG